MWKCKLIVTDVFLSMSVVAINVAFADQPQFLRYKFKLNPCVHVMCMEYYYGLQNDGK